MSSKADIALAMNEIEIFGSFSGLILNRNKTEGIWIGSVMGQKTAQFRNIKLESYTKKIFREIWKNWLILLMNIDNGKSIENFNDIPEFYKEIINCWVEFGGGQAKTSTNFREIRNQNI